MMTSGVVACLPIWPQDGPDEAQDGQDEAMAKMRLKMPKMGPKMAQMRPKMAKLRSKMAKMRRIIRATRAQRWTSSWASAQPERPIQPSLAPHPPIPSIWEPRRAQDGSKLALSGAKIAANETSKTTISHGSCTGLGTSLISTA